MSRQLACLGQLTSHAARKRCRSHAFEADRDDGAGFMARKRKRKAPTKRLKVREPIARYFVHSAANPGNRRRSLWG